MQTRRSPIATHVIVAAIAAAITAVPLLGQDLALKYSWPKGEDIRYQFSSDSTSVISGIPGLGELTTVTSMTQVHSMGGDSVAADGVSTLHIKIESVKTTTSNPMTGPIVYDSTSSAPPADPNAAQLAAIYGPMIGAPLTATMAPNGAVKTFEGVAKLKDAAAAVQQVAAGLGMGGGADLMSDESMKATYQMFASLPDGSVKTGESWKRTLTVPSPLGAQTVSMTYTAKGVEQLDGHDVVHIAIAETIKTAPGGAMGPMTVSVGDGTGTGDAMFNAKLGRLERCIVDVSMPMTMSMTGPDGSAMNLQATSKAKTTVQMVKK